MSLVFYISAHGFGHASRDIEVINAVLERRPAQRVVVRTSAPKWLFDLTLAGPVEFCPLECDTGIVQIDSLQLDAAASISRAAAFHARLAERAGHESEALRRFGASLVVGDIPPLAFAAATRARVRSIALGNFSWDWIYAGYPAEIAGAPTLLETIRAAYAGAHEALRLPFAGGFEPFARVVDVPLVARRARRSRSDVRQTLNLPADATLVLVSFGGHGFAGLDLPAVARTLNAAAPVSAGYSIVFTEAPGRCHSGAPDAPCSGAPDAPHSGAPGVPAGRSAAVCHQAAPGVFIVDERGLYGVGLRYEDLVAAADVVATKPGYGIIAECIVNDTAMLYTSRGHFVEYDVLVREMPRYVRCEFITPDDLRAGRWAGPLARLLARTPAPERMNADGAGVVADRLLEYL